MYTNYRDAFNPMVTQETQQSAIPMYGNIKRYDVTVGQGPNITLDTIPAMLIVDSSKRNRAVYPNPGQYIMHLNKPYTDVISIELVSASLPNSGYAVTQYNNKIHFNYNDTDYTTELPIGNYEYDNLNDEPSSLINQLISILNNATGINPANATNDRFNVTFNAQTQRFTFSGPATTTRLTLYAGRNNNADKILGLGYLDQTAVRTIVMPNNYMLRPYQYIIMKIREFDRCDGNSAALDSAFAVIPLDTTLNNFTLIKEGDMVDNETYVYYFPEPKRKLGKLDITFHDPDGNIYDFNGRDHYLTFQIQSLNRAPKYKGCN